MRRQGDVLCKNSSYDSKFRTSIFGTLEFLPVAAGDHF